jgi:hypothetical protein
MIRCSTRISFNLRLLAAAGFYLGDVRAGNAAVQISKLSQLANPEGDPLALAAKTAMDKPWGQTGTLLTHPMRQTFLVRQASTSRPAAG